MSPAKKLALLSDLPLSEQPSTISKDDHEGFKVAETPREYSETPTDSAETPRTDRISKQTPFRAWSRKDPNSTVRLSPMASALLRIRTGTYLPPTHLSTPIHSTHVASPACSSALRNHVRQTGPVHVPDLKSAYRTKPPNLSLHTPRGGTNPNSSTQESNLPWGSLSPETDPGMSPICSTPWSGATAPPTTFYPALHEKGFEALNASAIQERTKESSETPDNTTSRSRTNRVRRRALLIGISYRDNSSQKYAPVNGECVRQWYDMLVGRLSFVSREVRILTDDRIRTTGSAQVRRPTRVEIVRGLSWLVDGASEGDRLLLAYSGDVVYQSQKCADPTDPGIHGLVPCDYPKEEGVWDHQILETLYALHPKANLTIFLDSRMSWNIIRLPYIYVTFKHGKHTSFEMGRSLVNGSLELPYMVNAFEDIMRKGDEVPNAKENLAKQLQYFEERKKLFESCGNVVVLAGSPVKYRVYRRYKSLGVNWLKKGEFTESALSSIEDIAKDNRDITYRELIFNMAGYLSPRGTWFQSPQICSTRDLNLDDILLI